MIQITRSLARQLRAVFRRSAGRPSSLPRPAVVLQAGAAGLRVSLAALEVAAEYHLSGSFAADELTIPLDALNDFEAGGIPP